MQKGNAAMEQNNKELKKLYNYFGRISVQIIFLKILNVIILLAAIWRLNTYNGKFDFNRIQNNLMIILGIAFIVLLVLEYKLIFLTIKRLETNFSNLKKDNKYNEENVETFFKHNLKKDEPRLDKAIEAVINEHQNALGRELKAELLRKNTELSSLINQINPHFLYNTLDSIRGFAILHDMNELADIIESLSSLFRSVVTSSKERIKLAEELKNVNSYMSIQQFRFNNRFHFVQNIEDKSLLDYNLLNLTLQPIVENAIYHGLEGKVGKGEIIVSVYSTEKRLIIMVSDNGVGIEPEKVNELNDAFLDSKISIVHQSNSSGIALNNINKRIKLCFGQDYGLKILSTVGIGTDVEIILPLIPNDSEEVPFSFED
jgi:two-component system sensor histidine kinase YesM